MAYPKGKPRPEGAGRKKGTPNKSTQSLLDICKSMNYDPFRALIEFAQTGGLEGDDNLRFNAAKEIAQYVLPKRKAVEVSGNISPETLEASEQVTELSNEEKIKLLENEIKALKNGP